MSFEINRAPATKTPSWTRVVALTTLSGFLGQVEEKHVGDCLPIHDRKSSIEILVEILRVPP
ncbi:MAG: hypothetical protein ACYCOX_09675 [Acidobacteriaceae bacterium]